MENNISTQKQGVERSSIEKIFKIIGESNLPLTPSELSEKSKIQFDSVKSVLELLSNLDKIQIITNGKVSLIQLKRTGENNATI